jgi:hypothetical protein
MTTQLNRDTQAEAYAQARPPTQQQFHSNPLLLLNPVPTNKQRRGEELKKTNRVGRKRFPEHARNQSD